MTLASHIHSSSIIAMLYSMGPSIHMPGECMGREQSHIGIIIRLIIKSCVSVPFIPPTWILGAYHKPLHEMPTINHSINVG